MPDYNIKISELNAFPTASDPVRTEDFFPLVNSSSMTTYRTTIQNIGSLITHSIYADTASYLQNAPNSISASWASSSLSASYASQSSYTISASYALTASYAISSSHANLADSSSYYPPSGSWASSSIWSLYASQSQDVATCGVPYNFPWWTSTTPYNGNSDLAKSSQLVYYPGNVPGQSDNAMLIMDTSSTVPSPTNPCYLNYPTVPLNFTVSHYNNQANASWAYAGSSGYQSFWPVTSQTFIGTDQRGWGYSTASLGYIYQNTYWSGSADTDSAQGNTSGSLYQIPGSLNSSTQGASGGLSQIFNGHWVRFVSWGGSPADITHTAPHSAKGEVTMFRDQILKGLISIQVQTAEFNGGSNAWNQVDLWVHAQTYAGGGISANVLHTSQYGPQLIKAFRIFSSTTAGYNMDPVVCIDMLINNLYVPGQGWMDGAKTIPGKGEPLIQIFAQSWQGIRFLEQLNIDPWPFVDVFSSSYSPYSINTDLSQLIFPSAPGHYSNVSSNVGYYIQGKPVTIWPTYNQLTSSLAAQLVQPYGNAGVQSLYVSGGIEASANFVCGGNAGITHKVAKNTWNNLYFSGGLLVKAD